MGAHHNMRRCASLASRASRAPRLTAARRWGSGGSMPYNEPRTQMFSRPASAWMKDTAVLSLGLMLGGSLLAWATISRRGKPNVREAAAIELRRRQHDDAKARMQQ